MGMAAAVVMTAGLVAEATGGRLVAGAPETTFGTVSIDSRTVSAGALFIAIQGDRFDGHAFVTEAIRRGAAGVMVSREVELPAGVSGIRVDDTLRGLQSLARGVRRRSGATVIAITGSAGKTSTKELAAELLAIRYRVFRNQGNLNNHIGLPLSLLGLAAGPEMAVVELGMNHAGEIRTLVGIAEPETRVWTNVGDAHIGHFGTREAIARAKAEVLEAATAGTRIVANADDALVMAHVEGFAGRIVTFGIENAATVRATDIEDRGFAGLRAIVRTPSGAWPLGLALPGRAHLMNVLAAVAVALEYGVDVGPMAARLAAARPVPRRGEVRPLTSGARLIDDTYNASPSAVRAMLQTLAATPAEGRRIAVIGEMLELGDDARALHEACGRAAAAAGVDVLVAVGGAAADGLIDGAVAAGFPVERAHRFADAASACAPVVALVRAGDLVLVKGSHGTRTDLIADAMLAAGGQA